MPIGIWYFNFGDLFPAMEMGFVLGTDVVSQKQLLLQRSKRKFFRGSPSNLEIRKVGLASLKKSDCASKLHKQLRYPTQACHSSQGQKDLNISQLDRQFATADPAEIINYALSTFGDDVAIAFSGAEDVVLLEYARRTGRPFRVFALDTGRLHPETYRFYEKAANYFNLKIDYQFPDAQEVQKLVTEKGLFSFYKDGHQECCGIRKVNPLRKKLSTLRAWITGQRRDQSPSTRNSVPSIQIDPTFRGSQGRELIKFNPLANRSSEQVWSMIRALELPYNEIHERGYISIGCEPCTRPVLPNQHEREGRWWWEEATQKECGLHKGNLSSEGTETEATQLVEKIIREEPVAIFAKSDCPFCKQARELLEALGISFKLIEVDQASNGAEILQVLLKKTGQRTVPNIFISQKHIGGWTQLEQLHLSGTTDNQLWTEKYQPLRVTELLGQVRIHRQILHVIQNWKKMLLDRSTYPSMYEDAKTPNGLRCLVFDSCATAAFSQDMKNCLQILAENARKGVAGKETKSVCFPVIIICDDAYSKWFNPLRRFSKVIHFEASDTKSLSSRVAKIWQWETEHNLDQSILEKLCETAFGDIRWVLNTLQLYSNCAENTHDDFTKEDGLFWFKNISTDNLLQVVTRSYLLITDRALDGSSSSMFDHGWGDSLAGMDYEYLLEISPDIAVKVVETNSDLKKLSSTMDIQIECEKSMGRYNHDMTELMRTVGPILISHYANIISRRKVNLLDKINNRRLSIQNMKKNTKTLQELRKSLPASHWNVGNNQLIMETLPILCSILDH
eukprot:jgi/Galph1/4849/GphlegSOOS_G3582.1